MNNVKYVNFKFLLDNTFNIITTDNYRRVFAGMYILTILVKDGFKGLRELEEDKIRREVKDAIARMTM